MEGFLVLLGTKDGTGTGFVVETWYKEVLCCTFWFELFKLLRKLIALLLLLLL